MSREFSGLRDGIELLKPYVDNHTHCVEGWSGELNIGLDRIPPNDVRQRLFELGWIVGRPDAPNFAIWGAR